MITFVNNLLQIIFMLVGVIIILNKWTGEVIGLMHIHQIGMDELAKEIGFSRPYLSAVLNGKRNPKNAEDKCKAGIKSIVENRKSG